MRNTFQTMFWVAMLGLIITVIAMVIYTHKLQKIGMRRTGNTALMILTICLILFMTMVFVGKYAEDFASWVG